MKQRTLIVTSAIIIFSMIAVPISLGYVYGTVTIQDNFVKLEESVTGGMELPPDVPMEIRPCDSEKFGGYPGFWIHDPSAGNDFLLGTRCDEDFELVIPANTSFIIMVERPSTSTLLTKLEFEMRFEGETDWDYYANNKRATGVLEAVGVRYYSAASAEYMNGKRLLPAEDINELEFMEYDRDVILDIKSKREQFVLRLAIIYG